MINYKVAKCAALFLLTLSGASFVAAHPAQVDLGVEAWIRNQIPEDLKENLVLYTKKILDHPVGMPLAGVRCLAKDHKSNEACVRTVELIINPYLHDRIERHIAQPTTAATEGDGIKMAKAVLQHEFAHITLGHLDDPSLLKQFLSPCVMAAVMATMRYFVQDTALPTRLATGLGLGIAKILVESFLSRREERQADDCIQTEAGGQKIFSLFQKYHNNQYASLPRAVRLLLPKKLFFNLADPLHPTPQARLERLNARFEKKRKLAAWASGKGYHSDNLELC